MHWPKCSLLFVTLCASYWQNSAASTKLTNSFEKNGSLEASKENETNLKLPDSAEFEPIFTVKITRDSTLNLTENLQEAQNFTEVSEEPTNTTLNTGIQFHSNSDSKTANVTFNDIKPLLLFPILPFLFPPKEKDNQTSIISPENDKLKMDETPNKVKPFIFFDFAFIRRIPLNNTSNITNDSNLINVKNLKVSKVDDSKNSVKNRKRRNTSIKFDTPEFFDDSPFFPDSELDEFLPKSDLFFPDLPFHHHKPPKKLSRRKRDQKKPDLKSDLKFLFDAFDEAFMQTKRELEQTDPILNFLRGSQPSFDDDKKKNIFGPISNIQDKPRMKWRIQRNIKRLKNDHQDGLRKVEDGPMIIVDKFVKIGEFHVPDDGMDKNKLKKRKIENETKKLIGDEMTSFEKDDTLPKTIFDLKQEEKLKKTNYPVKFEIPNELKIQPNEVKIEPQTAAAAVTDIFVPPNNTRVTETDSQAHETKDPKIENLMKVIDTLKAKMKLNVGNDEGSNEQNPKIRGSTYYEKLNSKKVSYENLKKNITELLNQFLNLSKNAEDVKLLRRAEHDHDDAGVFDWTEKETLLNSNALEKNTRERRQKKDTDFADEFVDLSKKERQIADLNYLFLTVTLPTVFVFALVLLVCFFSLQVKGKICSRLFRPRQVYIVEDEKLMEFKNTTDTKHHAI